MKKRILFFLLSFLISFSSFSQTNIRKDDQQWLEYVNKIRLSDRFSFLSDFGFRWKDQFQVPSQYLLRTSLTYIFSEKTHVALGFANLGTYTDNAISRQEFRPYQELDGMHHIGKLNFIHRLRSEQRYFRKVEKKRIQKESNFNHRFRYRLLVDYPIITNAESEKVVSFHVGNEFMMNAGKENAPTIFDQNRIIVGPTVYFSKHIALNLNYMNTYASTSVDSEYRSSDIFWVSFKHLIDLR